MPSNSRKKRFGKKNKDATETEGLSDLTDEEKLALALEISKIHQDDSEKESSTLHMSEAMNISEDDKELELVLALSLDPDEQINKEHQNFFTLLKNGRDREEVSVEKDYKLDGLDEDEQLLIALRRSTESKENRGSRNIGFWSTRNKGRENTGDKENCLLSNGQILTSPRPKAQSTNERPKIVVSSSGGYSPFRPIIIDGCNVAWSHGLNKYFSAKGLILAYRQIQSLGPKDIVIFVRSNLPEMDDESAKIMKDLKSLDVLKETPENRSVGGKKISYYDDLMIVDYATKVNGIVLSNDHFEDIADHSKQFKSQIRNGLLPFTWVNNVLLLPQDPLGKKGPKLKEFLQY